MSIHAKCVSPGTAEAKERKQYDKKENRELVLLDPDKYFFTPEINIYNDVVMIASWKERIAIQIKSQEIVDMFKVIYKLAWTQAEKEKL